MILPSDFELVDFHTAKLHLRRTPVNEFDEQRSWELCAQRGGAHHHARPELREVDEAALCRTCLRVMRGLEGKR
jgi:hypothetical protein